MKIALKLKIIKNAKLNFLIFIQKGIQRICDNTGIAQLT